VISTRILTTHERLRSQQRGCIPPPKPKLDTAQVAAVRHAHANGETVASLARVHKVSRMTVYRMLESQR
jgi:hypothetical protein